MRYLGSTFSPMMLAPNGSAIVREIRLAEVPDPRDMTSVISHEVTAEILSALLGEEVSFNRVNLILAPGDTLYCVIPNFRATEAREFTREEVEAAGYRCFQVIVA